MITKDDLQGLDPTKMWIIKVHTHEDGENIHNAIARWKEQDPTLNIRGFCVPVGIEFEELDFHEMTDEWLEAYIRALQDTLAERKNKS